MHLTIAELLAYTDEERAKWRNWFAAHGDEALQWPLAGEAFKNLGVFILHIFWAECFYAYWMRGEVMTPESEVVKQHQGLPNDQAAAIFDFGHFTRTALRAFTDHAGAEGWDRVHELTAYGIHFQGPARKLLAHILIHEIRHWAQVAILARQQGLAPPGDHDLLFSPSFGPLAQRV
jgi:uncharacterized damage-inducible protein DinB